MLINHNQNMLCLDEFDILALNAGAAMLSITVDILNLSGIST